MCKFGEPILTLISAALAFIANTKEKRTRNLRMLFTQKIPSAYDYTLDGSYQTRFCVTHIKI
jgi:hypothetical protein